METKTPIHDLVKNDFKTCRLYWHLDAGEAYDQLMNISINLCKQKGIDFEDELEKRKQKGLETYGSPLTINNGRNALQDALDEILDAACYIKQHIEESKTES